MFLNKITYFMFSEHLLSRNDRVRYLTRWASRRPAKVIPSEEYDEEKDTQIQRKPQVESNEKFFMDKSFRDKVNIPRNIKPLTISKQKQFPKITMDMLETTVDEEGNFIYTKMKDNDSRITTILTDVKSNNERDKKGLILLEGKRLIKDALDAKCKLEYIIFSRMQEVEYLRPSIPKIGAKLYKMPYREIQMWSNLTTSPGIMGIFKIPDIESYQPPKAALPLTVICDNVREADNLGAILRTCSGVGSNEILLSKGCVNVWDSKVLRSACGAHFKLKIQRKFEWDTFNDLIPPESNIFIADNKVLSLNSINENTDKQVLANLVTSIPVVPYYSVNYNEAKHNVLIVGGETEGISEESYKLVSNLKGTRLNIPLGNNVDSLNVGTALAIIVFEMKRQYLISKATNKDT